MRSVLTAWLALMLPAVAFAQRDARVPDPDPELERRTFVLPPGFEVNLWAADPMLAKPIQMNWDPQGRLWVATSETYPQIKPGEKANDKILILEDADGDGRADTTTVFADGLLIPTGVEPGDGGAYVANSTELVHLSASKPGQKADRKRILLSGFGTEDTHHIIHTFRWGPDARLYFNQSIYIHSHIETPHGVKRLNAGGIWRFDPSTFELDVFARGWINPWGHAFDRYGRSFVTDGANGEGINPVVPGGYYPTAQGPHAQRVLHGLNPGSPKHCGLEIVSGRHFPDDWQGDLITCDFRGHRVCRFKLSDDGSTFASREMTEVIKSNHPAFRPVDVKMGPDGALYIADWYNPIIQHGEVDFRDPRRDKTHGRIWRVTAQGRPLVPKPKLVDATIPELLEQLKAPEQWTRQQAKRVLKEHGKDKVLPDLRKWLNGLKETDATYPDSLLEVLWVIRSLGLDLTVEGMLDERVNGLWERLALDPNFRFRAAAVRLLVDWLPKLTSDDPLPALERFCQDDHPRVRLEAVRAAAHHRSAAAAAIALKALDKPMDRILDYALWLTVRELEPYWMPEFRAGKLTFGGDAKKLAFALNAVGNTDTVKPILALIDGGQVPKENLHGLYLLLAQIGGPAELVRVLDRATFHKGLADREAEELLRAVEESVRRRRVPAPDDAHALKTWLTSRRPEDESEHARAAFRSAVRLIGLWKLAPLRNELETLARSDRSLPAAGRAALLEAVAAFADERAKVLLLGLASDTRRPEVARPALAALVPLDPILAAEKAVAFLTTARPDPELTDLYAVFLARKGGAAALARALAGQKLPPDVAKLGLRAVRASPLPAADLADALTAAGNLSAVRRPPTDAEIAAWVAEASKADPARGEAVYRRKELQCQACHAIAGAGGRVGPDLTSIGTSAPVDYLVESLLVPAKAVKEGYHATRVVTAEDQVIVGIKVREADGVLVLRTAEDREVAVPLRDIAERGEARSLMPEGLTEPLTRQEFADLVAFLTHLGKVGTPYAPSPARLVRRWQVVEPTSENLNRFRRSRVALAAEPDNPLLWSAVYSRVSGVLPLAELPQFTVWKDTAPLTVLRCHLDVTTAGSAALRFNSVAGLSVYLDSRPLDARPEIVVDLAVGLRTVTLVIDRTVRTEDVRVELGDVPGSAARVAVVGGK